MVGDNNNGTVTSCYNTGDVTGSERVGGVVGYNNYGTVTNCYNTGAVSGSGDEVGGVVGYNYGSVTNSYYNSLVYSSGNAIGWDGGGTVTNVEGKTTEAFALGEVAYLLGDAFGQTIGEDAYPNFTGAKVYRNIDCKDNFIRYSNTDTVIHGEFENGFCSVCGGYEAAVLNADGVYEISNAGQLYWFAAQVNGGDNAINGKLMENITVNENVLTENGELNSGSENFRAWTPIGSDKAYTGSTWQNVVVFDGNGKTVSGLYFNDSTADEVGLFGFVGQYGTVKNVGVVDSWFCGNEYVGGIVGYNNGYIENCYNTGAVSGGNRIGGIAGENTELGYVYNCYNIGSVSGSSNVGGIAGENAALSYVYNCYYLDTCGATGAGTVKTAEAFASGEVAYLLGDAFGQTIGTEDHPVLGGAKVYYGYGSCADTEFGYTNNPDTSETKPDHEHDPVTGKCANCDDIKLIEYKLWVGGAQVTSRNLIISGTTGTATYDPANNTLTLDGYSYTGAGYEYAAIYYSGDGTLKLVLVNNNSIITHTDATYFSSGIYVYNGSITISGSGSLTATGGNYGVCVYGDINATGGSLTATGGNYGVEANGAVSVSGSSSLTATGGTYGGVYGGLTLGEGIGILTPVGGYFDADKRAVVDADGDIAAEFVIGKGYIVTVNAAQNGTVSGAGAYAEGDTVTLTITPNYGYGLESLTVDGENVTAAVKNNTYTFTMPAKAVAVTATFGQVTPYDLWVGGTRVTSHNAADVFGDGKVSYDPTTNALTLNNYTYEGVGNHFAAIYYDGSDTLQLVLNGENTVVQTGVEGVSYGVYAVGSIRVLDGSADGIGSLKATSGNTTGSSYGVAADSIEVTGGSLTGNSGAAGEFSYGVTAGSIKVMGGSLTGSGDEADFSSYGVYANNGGIEVTGGSLTGSSSDTVVISYGVYAKALTMGTGIGILTPKGGYFDNNQYAVVDAADNIATEVVINEGYTVTVNPAENGTVSGAGTYAVGANVTLTVTPGKGYALISLIVDGENVNAAVENDTYTFTMPARAVEVTATFERVDYYDLWVGGEQFTSGKLTINGITGTATYNHASNTLTLNGYTYEGAGHTWEEASWDGTHIYYGAGIYYGGTAPLNLILKGESTVTHTGNENLLKSYGLYAKGNVIVSEDIAGGSLTVTGGTAADYSYGVYLGFDYDENYNLVGGELTISGGSLIATGGEVFSDSSISYGLRIERSTVINGGSIIARAMEQTNENVRRVGMVYGESIDFAGGFGILTPVGGKISYGDILDSSDEVADYVELGAGHTVMLAQPENGNVIGAGVYKAGSTVGLHISTEIGYAVKSVTATYGENRVDGTLSGDTYTFTMPAADVAVTVTLEHVFTPHDINIGGQWFSDKTLTISDGKGGTATYDPVSNTLTLKDYTYTGEGYRWKSANNYSYGAAIYYSGTDPLNLILEGDSVVTHTGSGYHYSYGLYSNGNVIVSADSLDDSLTATGGAASYATYGVYLQSGYNEEWQIVNGELTLLSGSLTANGGSAESSYGVCANGSIEVSSSLTGTGGNVTGVYGSSYGVYANGSITVSGSLHATSGAAEYGSYGVSAFDLTMGTGIGILTPEGGNFDNGWYTVVDAGGNPAKEVEIGIAVPAVTWTDGKLTITNSAAEADEKVDMIIMVAGYTGGRMTGCQEIREVTGITETDLTVTGDTIRVFFLQPGTYAPLFAYKDL